MSDRMTPIPFDKLVDWILREREESGTVFHLHKPYYAGKENWKLFGRKLETVIGPAAGPHTQLAQNIIASYYAGSRFFELKTVQKIDGEDLPVSKPCIKADDEGYNVEWSTELYVPQALDEYIKSWFLLKIMAKEYGIGEMDGFQFNMSVGYDLEGIKLPKIDHFIETLKDASKNDTFNACKKYLKENISKFKKLSMEDVDKIEAQICNSATISTLHGCPPAEIERIAVHLLTEKKLHTFIKCNPTLLGYEFARKTMDEMGYDYIAFGDFHFKDDLQWEDAVPMLHRLMKLSAEKGLDFGVKITNTFPVDIKANELPGEEMYMSGKSLYPLSFSLATRLSKEFDGKLRISYSGGADYFNIEKIADCGIWPITMATTLLKTGGYERLKQMAEKLETLDKEFRGVDVAKAENIANNIVKDARHVQTIKPLPSRKMNRKVPLYDCFVAPCKEGCPINQDITKYMQLAAEGKYKEAMDVIADRNPLPWITGTLCPHNCMTKCTRNFYEDPVHIRDMKLYSAQYGYDEFMKEISRPNISSNKKIAIIGGGPAGLSAAYFCGKAGFQTTIFEKEKELGGVVSHIIPDFRIDKKAIEKDIALAVSQNAEIRTGVEIKDINELRNEGFDYILLAIGAHKPGVLRLEGDPVLNALEFLRQFKETAGTMNLGKNVAVIGGGNTAMDTARAALKNKGVENVYLIYRRTKRYMPAEEEELLDAIKDGVIFKELLSPLNYHGGKLECEVMKLADMDASGRRAVISTGEKKVFDVNTVIAAVGEKADTEFFIRNRINVSDRGNALLNSETLESSNKNVYLIGDCMKGPATIVEAIADAIKVARSIAQKEVAPENAPIKDIEHIYTIKGVLEDRKGDAKEGDRCLNCAVVCENCVEVCPNRANVSIRTQGSDMQQIIHIDYMCNECGNCKSFCPYDSAPYLDKLTYFETEEDFKDSTNEGFRVIQGNEVELRYLGNIMKFKISDPNPEVEEGVIDIIKSFLTKYDYMMLKETI